MEDLLFSLFTDTGGILIFDPLFAEVISNEGSLAALNVVLDPEGRTDQVVGSRGEWSKIWSAAVTEFRAMTQGGKCALVLSGEGTFHIRVTNAPVEPTGSRETSRALVEVTSGKLAITDGMALFEGEKTLPADRGEFVELANGWYTITIHDLGRHPSLVPTVGVFGNDELPVLSIAIAQSPSAENTDALNAITRLKASYGDYEKPAVGWFCHAEVKGVEKGMASLSLMRTASISSGWAQMSLPTNVDLAKGDLVLVKLIEKTGSSWRAAWEDSVARPRR